jgi:hypothetical protein
MNANHTWPLFSLRQTLSNLVFYFDVPGEETGTDGWVSKTRSDIQQCFANAIDTGAIDRDTLVARRSDALTLISILNHNPGVTAKESGANAQSSIRKLVELCEQLEATEQNAPEPAKSEKPNATNAKTSPPILDDTDVAILNFLNKSPSVAKAQEDIAAGADVGRKAVGERLAKLRECGYVARPLGKKSKDAITPDGIERIAPKVTQK